MASVTSLGLQFHYPESEAAAEADPFAAGYVRTHRLYASNDLVKMFGGAPSTTAPWDTAPRSKTGPGTFDRIAVANVLSRPPQLREFDPRHLHATQPSVLRHIVSHYLEGDYERTGNTFADQHNVGNKYPVVYTNHRGMNIILSGHHRASAALLRGQPLLARHVRGEV